MKDHARCNGFASNPVYSIIQKKKTIFQAAGPHQNPKNSSLLFAFPHVLPISIALLWLRLALLHTVCQCTRKVKREPCTKTLPCSVVSARPDTPCPQFTSQTHNLSCFVCVCVCACAIILMRVVADRQDNRSLCKCVNAMSDHIYTLLTRYYFKSALIPKNVLRRSANGPIFNFYFTKLSSHSLPLHLINITK